MRFIFLGLQPIDSMRGLIQQSYTFKKNAFYDRNNGIITTSTPRFSYGIWPSKMNDAQWQEYCLQCVALYPASTATLMHSRTAPFVYITRTATALEIANFQNITPKPWKLYSIVEPIEYRTTIQTVAKPIIGSCDIDGAGISGLELYYNDAITQSAIQLHLDLELCSYAHEILTEQMHSIGSTSGALLILNGDTGEIECITQHHDSYNDQLNPICDESHHCHLMPITHAYEFGSVIKPFVALAALHYNIIEEAELIDCENTRRSRIGGFEVSTWKACGKISLAETIKFSNNIGIVKVARRVGKKNLHQIYSWCGFGQKTGVDWPGEVAGTLRPPSKWSLQSINSLAFGYEVQATMLQLAVAYAQLCNGGNKIVPRFNGLAKPEKNHFEQLALDKTMQMLQIDPDDKSLSLYVRLYGKTGSARMLNESGTYSTEHARYTFAGIIEQIHTKPTNRHVIIITLHDSHQKNIYARQAVYPIFESIAHWFSYR